MVRIPPETMAEIDRFAEAERVFLAAEAERKAELEMGEFEDALRARVECSITSTGRDLDAAALALEWTREALDALLREHPHWSCGAYVDPRPRHVGAWQSAPCRSGGRVAVRWDWRRGEAPRWVVVAYDSSTPSQGYRAGDLRVLYDAGDERGARERWSSLAEPR